MCPEMEISHGADRRIFAAVQKRRYSKSRSIASATRDADVQQIAFEFGEIAANLFRLRICCKFAVKFTALQIRRIFGLLIR